MRLACLEIARVRHTVAYPEQGCNGQAKTGSRCRAWLGRRRRANVNHHMGRRGARAACERQVVSAGLSLRLHYVRFLLGGRLLAQTLPLLQKLVGAMARVSSTAAMRLNG